MAGALAACRLAVCVRRGVTCAVLQVAHLHSSVASIELGVTFGKDATQYKDSSDTQHDKQTPYTAVAEQ